MKSTRGPHHSQETHARFNYPKHHRSSEHIHKRCEKHDVFKLFKLWPSKKTHHLSADTINYRKTRKELRHNDVLDVKLVMKKEQNIPKTTVYSDLYFRKNKSLNGVMKNIRDYTQLENNSLVCGYYFEEQNYTQTQNELKNPHLAIFEVRKTVEYIAVLRDFYLQYDFDINVAAFRRKCFEKAEINNNSFREYIPLITVHNSETYEQYFETKKIEDIANRVSHLSNLSNLANLSNLSKRKKFGKIWASNSDLDKITPVKYRKQEIDREFNLSSLSVQELEEILLTDQQSKFKVRSLEDLRMSRNFPTLEPLLLKDEDEIDSEKIRLRISEHKKIVRITIAYTLAFFVLAIITFYIIYYA